MTNAPRLVQEMTDAAASLKQRAAGYRFTGERRLARSAQIAADLLDEACAALITLAANERDAK